MKAPDCLINDIYLDSFVAAVAAKQLVCIEEDERNSLLEIPSEANEQPMDFLLSSKLPAGLIHFAKQFQANCIR